MGTPEILTIAGLGISVLSGIGWLIFRSGKTFNRVENVEREVLEIRADVGNIKVTLPALTTKVDALWEARISGSNSPRQLNEVGKKIFEQSGIKQIIDERSDQIVQRVKDKKPQNAYQAEECIIDVIRELKSDPALMSSLENGAFDSGTDVDTVLLVGAIGIRDDILKQLKFADEDIDKDS